jgi:hypothetical protein
MCPAAALTLSLLRSVSTFFPRQSFLGQVTFDTLLLFVKLEGQLQEVGRARVTVGAMHQQVLQAFGGSEKAAELAWNLMETLVFILESLHSI